MTDYLYVAERFCGRTIIHLAEESPLGGIVTPCDLFAPVTVVEPVPDAEVCQDCLLAALAV